MTRRSHHHQLFVEMIYKIGWWQFVEAESGKQVHPPPQKGWLATIKGVQLLWQHFKDISKFFCPRSLNQEPVENLFNIVRQNCGCNHHPNANMFMGALKTSIVNGLLSSSMKGNCEDDGCNTRKVCLKAAITLISTQLRTATQNPRCQQSVDEKLFFLSIQPKTPKAYSLLSALFTLPISRTLSKSLSP
ncbi:hypothetical protein J437_LFUL018725 [Ladona fulva]|uniref:Transposable element P transposase-like RNase H C-terminal domain-containing protein n=1 Tax=Ladona fulva TaxID=123851 RepID=A0A8K0KSP7_LADFU|nr:hypothetical protein J437_LFUL018725 [Ladona fulva]